MAAFNWQELKGRTRRIVHNTFSGASTYQDDVFVTPIGLMVRWHNKIQLVGDLESGGYAESIEGIERVIFDREELAEKQVVLQYAGLVIMQDGTRLRLQTQEPIVGPIEVIWQVSRE